MCEKVTLNPRRRRTSTDEVPSSHIGALFLSTTSSLARSYVALCGELAIFAAHLLHKVNVPGSVEVRGSTQKHQKHAEAQEELRVMSNLHWGIDWDIARGPTPEDGTQKLDVSEHALVTTPGLRTNAVGFGHSELPALAALDTLDGHFWTDI